MAQDQKLGNVLLTIVEKETGSDLVISKELCADVPMGDLTDQVAQEFEAGSSYDRILPGASVRFIKLEGRRAYKFTASGGGALDNSLTLLEAGIRSGSTIELHKR